MSVLKSLEVDLITVSPGATWKPSTPPLIYRAGFVRFGAGGYWGAPQWVNAAQQRFFPEMENCNMVQWWFPPGTLGIVHRTWRTLDPFDAKILGQVVNIWTGQLAGLSQFDRGGAIAATAPNLINGPP